MLGEKAVAERQAMNTRALRLALTDGMSFEDVAAVLEREFPGAEFVKVPSGQPADALTFARSYVGFMSWRASCFDCRWSATSNGFERVERESLRKKRAELVERLGRE